jgi:hypothetical protein
MLDTPLLPFNTSSSPDPYLYSQTANNPNQPSTWAKKASATPQKSPLTNPLQTKNAFTYAPISLSLLRPSKHHPSNSLPQNRWHPDNPSYTSISPDEPVKIECVDWTGGQIGNNDSADDVRDVDLSKIHYLTGPFDIETAEPGDVLVVEILDVQPMQDQPWGFTGIFAKSNGGGFLDGIYPEP